MARIDLFAFGGGQAALPMMFHEVVTVQGWMDSTTFLMVWPWGKLLLDLSWLLPHSLDFW
jgi:chromate transporter